MRVPAARPLFPRSHWKHALVAGTVEPWLRGPIPDVNAAVMPLFFTFKQVREDLDTHTRGLTREQVWHKLGAASVGFHLKHIAGSIDRLTTYLMGQQLTSEQLAFLEQESQGDEALPQLLHQIDASCKHCEQRLQRIPPDSLYQPRGVGRQALPTTVLGLIVHIAEHTQRHLGQAITLSQALQSRVLRQLS